MLVKVELLVKAEGHAQAVGRDLEADSWATFVEPSWKFGPIQRYSYLQADQRFCR